MQPPSSPAGAAAAQPEGRASTIGAGAEQGKAGEMPNLKVPCPGGEAGHPKCVEVAGRGSSAPAKQQRSWVALSTAKAQPWDPPRDTKLAGDTPPSSVGSCEGKRDAAQRLQDVLEQGRSTCTGLRSEHRGFGDAGESPLRQHPAPCSSPSPTASGLRHKKELKKNNNKKREDEEAGAGAH